jgi:hypothetical protein
MTEHDEWNQRVIAEFRANEGRVGGGFEDAPMVLVHLNLVAAGQATIEVRASTYPVTVTEVSGGERDRIFAEQVRRMPVFGEYAAKTAGIRTIPVLELARQ